MDHEYLGDLNAEQRHAVQHGMEAKSATTAPPLLVIAGAGSGKTKTLAHRVAHVGVSGCDPCRIFWRRHARLPHERNISALLAMSGGNRFSCGFRLEERRFREC